MEWDWNDSFTKEKNRISVIYISIEEIDDKKCSFKDNDNKMHIETLENYDKAAEDSSQNENGTQCTQMLTPDSINAVKDT